MKRSLKFYIAGFLFCIFIVSYLLAYVFITKRYEEIVLNELNSSAKMLAQQILITRKWVALHTFVLVEKDGKIEPNPFLEEPYVEDKYGKIYVKMNPAFVTREIAKLAEKEKGFYFRVVSLNAVNPKNTPDEFEKEALLAFERKNKGEFYSVKDRAFRYVIPLYTEESCISCHKNYKVGDVRGALSIFLPSDELFIKLKKTKLLFFILLTLFHIVVFAGFWLFFDRFVIEPVHKLALFAEGKEELKDTEFNIEELFVLSEKLRSAKLKDERIKEILKDEVEKATNELKAINDKKSEFLLEVGHKLKTPLTVISTSIDYLLMKGGCVEESKYLELLKKNVAILKRALNQILKTAQIDMNIEDESFEKVNLSKLLQEVLNAFSYERIISNIEDNLYVYGAKEKLVSLFENLIHNAIKFNRTDGNIYINLEKTGGYVLFRIRDEGLGIKEEDKPFIFDKFFYKNYNGKEKGTGLGLYIAKKVVELHKGEIYFTSSEKEGTTFFVKLPLMEGLNG